MLKTLAKTQCQRVWSAQKEQTSCPCFCQSFSDNKESFPPTFSLGTPYTNGNFRSKIPCRNNEAGGETKPRLAEECLFIFPLCCRNILSCHCSLTRHTMITSIVLLFLNQLEDQPQETSHCQLLLQNMQRLITPRSRLLKHVLLLATFAHCRGTSIPKQKPQPLYIHIRGNSSSFH